MVDTFWEWVERDDARIEELRAVADDFLAFEPGESVEVDAVAEALEEALRWQDDANEYVEELRARARGLLPSGGQRVTGEWRLSVTVPKPGTTFDSAGFRKAEPEMFKKWQKERAAGKPRVTVTKVKK